MKMKIQGLEELQRDLKKLSETTNDVKDVVKKHGSQMQQKAMKNARHRASGGVFAKGYYDKEGKWHFYSTGHTRRNLQQNGVKISDGGLTATVESTTDYAAYVEYGTRKMEAEPYMKPAYEKQKKLFEEDIEKVVEKNL